jgi:hypothetical protein
MAVHALLLYSLCMLEPDKEIKPVNMRDVNYKGLFSEPLCIRLTLFLDISKNALRKGWHMPLKTVGLATSSKYQPQLDVY